jgi:AraC family transcriptional regulator of adaptative response/methylated-DNA-[protein]-cysteine methyltransferase
MGNKLELSTPAASRTPNEGKRIAEGIGYAIDESALGQVLVARSARGVCAVLLGDDAEELRRELRARFPDAVIAESGEAMSAVTRDVIALVESPGRTLEAPIDLRGTEFQRVVWDALRTIPPGETVSYTEVATRIGRPEAVRAVAGAIAANAIAVVVPCHRVIRGDGSLSGYRWGVERKRALLAREAAAPG